MSIHIFMAFLQGICLIALLYVLSRTTKKKVDDASEKKIDDASKTQAKSETP